MGAKTLPDTITERIYKALAIGREYQSANPCELVLLAGERGISEVYTIAGFFAYVHYLHTRGRLIVTDSKWGEFHGLIGNIRVYQPAEFNPSLIELRDTKGQFSYTIDLSEERVGE